MPPTGSAPKPKAQEDVLCILRIAVTDDGASAFAELRVLTEQYSFAPVGAYIPMPAKEYSAMESTPAGDQAMLRVTMVLSMVVEKGNIARLERELDEERSSLDQEARDEAKDSEEEAAYVRNGRNFRQLTTSKVKEVEQPKRKKPSCLCFSV
ncbi:hypothetical protein Taro_026308 [Colocasia esculenta]|uniref:Uncharacterized protein n=1 Tax=Colocasia esculenta TaxID=4460 RepID=A0A843VQY9_COLES|nr:hypothetical protein [Colocasia esculenta]